ncbi:hypothetical protein [Leifsonia sp. Leaf264]|uniref:hypothetical protein n=1 Tax=Leifsonia sp. Leaf264 TaxID=1736314 RepID=UPI0006FF4FCD|nr:hypothetical protein [Leifsonia sp. Leaf264]KQO98490.1 hypothetical protein ASF30_10535 [Leifsonia sp. Leaf264]
MTSWEDTDGDGFGDLGKVDLDGDGQVDEVLIDSDHDHVVDQLAVDTNKDGNADTVYSDTNRDGNIDAVGIDTNRDTVVDTILQDRGDGQFETVMEPGPTDPAEAIMSATVVGPATDPPLLMQQLDNPDVPADVKEAIKEHYATIDRMNEQWLQ